MVDSCRQHLLAALKERKTIDVREVLAQPLGRSPTTGEVSAAWKAAHR
jgi:hypothetical protein